MCYFNYHSNLKKLLNSEPYVCIQQKGKFAYRFIFLRIMKSFPIRTYRVNEYKEYIKGGI